MDINLKELYEDEKKVNNLSFEDAYSLVKENHKRIMGIPVSLMLLMLGLHDTQMEYGFEIKKSSKQVTEIGLDNFISNGSKFLNIFKQYADSDSYSELNITKIFYSETHSFQIQLVFDKKINLKHINIYVSEYYSI